MGPSFMIYGEHCWGGHAETAIAPERNVRKRPATRSWAECAAFPLAYLTAYRMLRRARLKSGDTLLVVGIGSGVSCAALAIGMTMGARVEVTSRSEQKQAQALEMGAAEAHDSGAPKWAVEADVVVESVGPATWDQSVRALKPGGRMVVCGSTSGPKVELVLPRLFFKQFEIIGSTMGSYQEFDEVLELVDGGLPITIDQSFPVERYPEALARMEHGEQLGKIVLTHEGG
jgi:NADPH:quinone reductase-like Zn-dependent oxidoreductase